MYWVAVEPNSPKPDEKMVMLRTCAKKDIKKVGYSFAKKIQMEGTGILNDGRGYNVDCRKQCNYNDQFDCFEPLPAKFPWGVGSNDNGIYPSTSVAVNKKGLFGKTIFVNEFKGLQLPNGQVHNGCVKVDDECPSCSDHIFDFFAGKKTWANQIYQTLNKFCVKKDCPDGLIGITYDVKPCTAQKYNVSF